MVYSGSLSLLNIWVQSSKWVWFTLIYTNATWIGILLEVYYFGNFMKITQTSLSLNPIVLPNLFMVNLYNFRTLL